MMHVLWHDVPAATVCSVLAPHRGHVLRMPHIDLARLQAAEAQDRLGEEAALQGGAAGARAVLEAYFQAQYPEDATNVDYRVFEAPIAFQARREAVVADLGLPAGLFVYGSFARPLETRLPEHPDALILDHDASKGLAFEAAHTYLALPYALDARTLAEHDLQLAVSPDWD